jgi:predicted nuclease with TOPRIM domain
VDLNDIYESSERFEKLLENIRKSQQNKDDLIDILIEVEAELDHINWHFKSLKKRLEILMED